MDIILIILFCVILLVVVGIIIESISHRCWILSHEREKEDVFGDIVLSVLEEAGVSTVTLGVCPTIHEIELEIARRKKVWMQDQVEALQIG